jgi:SAM-dependent methyltransferase
MKSKNNPTLSGDLAIFNPAIYHKSNLDLASLNLSEEKLLEHFVNFGHTEPRLFACTNTTSEFLSMKWLRGQGLEIGAGRYPTKLFGNANAEYADTDGGEAFGTKSIKHRLSIDGPMPKDMQNRYDFIIASHVLEHADGVIRSVSNLIDAIKIGGLVYIVVPDATYLEDSKWMPFFDFSHHKEEYQSPNLYDQHHDDIALSYMRAHANLLHPSGDSQFKHEDFSASGGQVSIKDLGRLLDAKDAKLHRFMLHKHTYNNSGWVELVFNIKSFLGARFSVEEVRYGMERLDVHFILRKIN